MSRTRNFRKQKTQAAMRKSSETHRPEIHRMECLAALPLVLLFFAPVLHMCISAVKSPAVRTLAGEQVMCAYDYLIWMYPVVAPMAAAVAALSLRERRMAAEETKPCLRRLLQEPMVWFGLFALLMVLSTAINGWTQAALHGVGNRRESLFSYLIYLFVYFYCGCCIRDVRLKRGLMYGFLGTALFVAVCTLGRGLMGGFPGLAYFEVYSGCFYNRNHYAYYLVMVLLVSAVLLVLDHSLWGRGLAGVSLCLNLVVLLRNGTLGGLVAVAAGLVLFGFLLAWQGTLKWRWLGVAAGLCGVGVAAALVAVPFLRSSVVVLLQDMGTILGGESGETLAHTGHNRMGQWLFAAELIREKPLFGWGVEGAAELMGKHTTASRVHSEYLYYAQSFGIPALVCYLGGLLTSFFKGLRSKLSEDPYSAGALMGAFGYAVSACFGISAFYTTPFFFAFLGLGCGGEPPSHNPHKNL